MFDLHIPCKKQKFTFNNMKIEYVIKPNKKNANYLCLNPMDQAAKRKK